MTSLYQKLKDAGCEMDSHESDLYVRNTETARRIIKESEVAHSCFTAQGTNESWIDVPFHYAPWWQRRAS